MCIPLGHRPLSSAASSLCHTQISLECIMYILIRKKAQLVWLIIWQDFENVLQSMSNFSQNIFFSSVRNTFIRSDLKKKMGWTTEVIHINLHIKKYLIINYLSYVCPLSAGTVRHGLNNLHLIIQIEVWDMKISLGIPLQKHTEWILHDIVQFGYGCISEAIAS